MPDWLIDAIKISDTPITLFFMVYVLWKLDKVSTDLMNNQNKILWRLLERELEDSDEVKILPADE